MARPAEFTYTYAQIAKSADMSLNSCHQHVARGNLDPDDLESVLVWLARHGKFGLRKRFVGAALWRELVGPKRRK